jgi:hypothetical protein
MKQTTNFALFTFSQWNSERTSKYANNNSNINIYSYLETSGGQNSNQHLNVVHFFNTSLN